jgi:hypothetical protein
MDVKWQHMRMSTELNGLWTARCGMLFGVMNLTSSVYCREFFNQLILSAPQEALCSLELRKNSLKRSDWEMNKHLVWQAFEFICILIRYHC